MREDWSGRLDSNQRPPEPHHGDSFRVSDDDSRFLRPARLNWTSQEQRQDEDSDAPPWHLSWIVIGAALLVVMAILGHDLFAPLFAKLDEAARVLGGKTLA